MPNTRRSRRHNSSGRHAKMNRTKHVPADVMETSPKHSLNIFDIALLGIGHMVSAGIYVLTGTVGKQMAGPGIILSFVIAGFVSMLAALCYAEFRTQVPKAGFGMKTTAIFNTLLTLINITVMILVMIVGFWYAERKNWTDVNGGFMPFGFGGVIAGATTCFYAFVGFEPVPLEDQKAKNPAELNPISTVLLLCAVTVGYILVSAALTLIIPNSEFNPVAFLPETFGQLDLSWAKYVISIGALCGMTRMLLSSFIPLPHCMYALEKINLTTQVPVLHLVFSGIISAALAFLFDLAKLVEFISIGTLFGYTIISASVIWLRYRPLLKTDNDNNTPSGFDTAMAGRLKTQYRWLEPLLGHFEPGTAVSSAVILFTILSFAICLQMKISWTEFYIGTWWTVTIFVAVACVAVIGVHNQNTRGLTFKVPFMPFVPALSIFCNIVLMVHLSPLTSLRFFIWFSFGILIYILYDIHHSKECLHVYIDTHIKDDLTHRFLNLEALDERGYNTILLLCC